MSTANRVTRRIESYLEEIAKIYQDEMDLMNPEVYGNWLAQTYYYVRQVERMLSFAASKCPIPEQNDLQKQLIQSLKEEMHHDKMVLRDLKSFGYTLNDFPELLETRNFIQSLIYMIETWGPVVLIGYFMPQEGLACTKLISTYHKLRNHYGDKATEFLKVHCALDVDHYKEGIEYIKSLPESELLIVEKGVERSGELYLEMMKTIATNSIALPKSSTVKQASMETTL